MQAVLLAGGFGTRLKPFTLENPKPLYPVQGRPFIDYLLDQIESFGINEVILLLGYKAEKIVEHFNQNPRQNLLIEISITPQGYETGARIRSARNLIHDDFLLMYCDNYCPIDFNALQAQFIENQALVQLTAYSNRDGYTKNNLLLERLDETYKSADRKNRMEPACLESCNTRVLVYDKSRKIPNLNAVDIGYALISSKVLAWLPQDEFLNFERFVYARALEENKLFATATEHRYCSIGSFDRMKDTEQLFEHRKAVFLDRDGTLNERSPQACYIETPEDFRWLPGAREAVKKLNDAGYLVYLVSNQPGLARGRLTEETLNNIHLKMIGDLAEIGAKIDAIYYCPHNWDEGCFCRKPQPGLLYQIQQDANLNIVQDCLLIGDDDRDIEAAHSARCAAIQVSKNYPLIEAIHAFLEGRAIFS